MKILAAAFAAAIATFTVGCFIMFARSCSNDIDSWKAKRAAIQWKISTPQGDPVVVTNFGSGIGYASGFTTNGKIEFHGNFTAEQIK